MKLMMDNSALKKLFPLAILTITAILIWTMGPFIAIANHVPLQQPEQRFYIIALIFLVWFLKVILFDGKQFRKELPLFTTPEGYKKWYRLHGHFQGAIEFFKKNSISKHGKNFNLSQLPWYLLIGPEGSGKTSLLTNSNINFILSKQFKAENKTPNGCDFWCTKDFVLLDVQGAYISAKEKKQTVDNILWNNLLRLIKRHRKNSGIRAIVYALHFPELIKLQSAQEKKQLVTETKQRIVQLQESFGHSIPFYFVITKCDLLPGFSEFFSEAGSDELAQAWGITLPSLKENEKLYDVFSNRFNALIKRINSQLIWRLHQERNPNARPAIKDFPLQVERLKETISSFLKALNLTTLSVSGVYLTSATQNQVDDKSIPLSPGNANHQALELARLPAQPSRTYFVRQLILQGLLSNGESHTTRPTKLQDIWLPRAAYAASLFVIATAAVFLGKDFQQSVQQAYSIQNDLTQYQLALQQNLPINHLVKALPLLNSLQDASYNSNRHISGLVNFLSFYSNKSNQTATKVYYQALQTLVIPEIKNSLEKYIKTAASDKNPAHLYAALKAYLMLADKNNLQSEFIVNTINELTPFALDKKDSEKLMMHVRIAFDTVWQPMELDNALIEQTRKQLTSLASIDLSMVILKNFNNNYQDSTIALGTNMGTPSLFVSKELAEQIPNMFTANNLEMILSQQIKTAALEALQGNWVLGTAPTAPNEADINTLATQLRTRYVSNYVDIWESLLANIQPNTPKNLPELIEMIGDVTGNHSPLLQLLKTMEKNTSIALINDASPKLQAINSLLTSSANTEQNPLFKIFVSLKKLQTYLQTITNASNPGKAALEVSKSRALNSDDPIKEIRDIALQSPEPMKTWLTSVANQSWNLMLRETGHYIERSWKKHVISVYESQIANRYPFNSNSPDEVDLKQFVAFMGQPGILSNFYQTFLKPFVDESGKKWQWKTIDNNKLAFSDTVLQQLQHAAQIQHAFFPNGDNKLFVQFTLEPLSIDASLKSANLNINGQEITYQKSAGHSPRVVSWPGEQQHHITRINLITPDNQTINSTFKSDWSWFRLVKKSTETIYSPKKILLSFNVNGHNVKYILFTEGRMNPFLPLNLQGFELSDDLG